jgi:superfamily II DNA/RNA helicase
MWEIHGDLEQDDRLKVMKNFKKGKFPFLVATDVAARGIDVDNIPLLLIMIFQGIRKVMFTESAERAE